MILYNKKQIKGLEVMCRKLDLIIGIFIVIYSISINLIFGKITFSEIILCGGIILIIHYLIKNKFKVYINSFSNGKKIINLKNS